MTEEALVAHRLTVPPRHSTQRIIESELRGAENLGPGRLEQLEALEGDLAGALRGGRRPITSSAGAKNRRGDAVPPVYWTRAN